MLSLVVSTAASRFGGTGAGTFVVVAAVALKLVSALLSMVTAVLAVMMQHPTLPRPTGRVLTSTVVGPSYFRKKTPCVFQSPHREEDDDRVCTPSLPHALQPYRMHTLANALPTHCQLKCANLTHRCLHSLHVTPTPHLLVLVRLRIVEL